MKYVGIDGCRLGWFYVGLDDDDSFAVGVITEFREIEKWLSDAVLILVDIPVGLLSEGSTERQCDIEARKMIKPRGSTVFPAPARSAISMSTYEAGSTENLRCLGRKLSRQSWAIAGKIREVDQFILSSRAKQKVREMHPEVAFCGLNGGVPLLSNKKTQEGFRSRIGILRRYCPMTDAIVKSAREGTPLKKHLQDDDILDALVGAVTASRYPKLRTLPEQPPKDDHGIAMEMVHSRSNDH